MNIPKDITNGIELYDLVKEKYRTDNIYVVEAIDIKPYHSSISLAGNLLCKRLSRQHHIRQLKLRRVVDSAGRKINGKTFKYLNAGLVVKVDRNFVQTRRNIELKNINERYDNILSAINEADSQKV